MSQTKTDSFKNTPLGIIPSDWSFKKFDKISSIVRGSSPRPAGDKRYFNGSFIPWLTVASLTNISDSQIVVIQTETYLTEEGSKQSRQLEKGTLILSNSGATLGVAKILGIRCCANDGIAAFINWNENEVDRRYAYYYLNSRTKYFRDVVAPGNGQPNLNTDLIGLENIPLPPLPEQRAIARVLSTWDEAINKTQALITQKELRKKWLMQMLLTGKLRLRSASGQKYEGGWKDMQLGDFIIESRIPSKTNDVNRRITVKLNLKGIEKRDVKGSEVEDATYFFTRKSGQFIYGKQNLHKGAFGIIPDYLDCFESSQDIPSFDFKKGVDPMFFLLFMSQENFYKSLEKISTGTGSKRIHPENLFKVKVRFPTLQEQKTISSILQMADIEVNLLLTKLDKLKEQKKGLMQVLLTGKKRLKI